MSGYIDSGRYDPCPCGSGKKFKRCCRDTVEELFDREMDRLLPRLVGRRETENLARKLIKELRREAFGPEKQQAVIFALSTCLEGGVNPVWETIFRISVSEAEVEDKDDPDGSEET